jgi:nucleoside 2-deoxyribosyltransferase
MAKIYLAGGFGTNWRERVKEVKGHIYIDPKEKETSGNWGLEKIGAWDLHMIRQGDIIFAYMEKTNPSGFGLSCEIGYAYGIGKTVILVLEPNHTIHKDKYLSFLKKVATITFETIEEGLEFLKTL